MTSILIAVITVTAVALTIVSARRTLAERNAVERHHRTLDVLGSVAGQASAAPGPPPPREYQPRHRKARSPYRGRPAWLAGMAALAVVALAVAWLVVGRRPRAAAPHQAQAPSPKVTGSTFVPSTTTPPGTTAPATALVLVSSDNQQAAYRITRPSVDIELVPTAACWVEIRTTAGQAVLFAGTLRPGSRKAVPSGAGTGGVSVRLGNPGGMSVSVDGAALPLPRPSGPQPFTLVLRPAA